MAEINAAYDLVRAAAQHDDADGAPNRDRGAEGPGRLADPAAAAGARPRAARHAHARRGRPARHADVDLGAARARSSPSPTGGCCGCSTTRRSPASTRSPSATWPRSSTACRAQARDADRAHARRPPPRLPRSAPAHCGDDRATRTCVRTDRCRASYRGRVRVADPVHHVELRRNAHGQDGRRLRVPVPGGHRGRGALDPRPALRLAGQGVVGAARRGHRAVRAGRARALPGARGRARRHASGSRARSRAGSAASPTARRDGAGWFVLDAIAGDLPEELRRSPRSAATGAGCRSRRRSAEALLELPGARLDQRALRCASQAAGRPRPRAGDADAGRELRRVALQARGQLGPGHGRRVRRAAGGRGARPHAADRPVPARAARALHPPARHRRRLQRARGARAAARPSTTRRSTPSAARAPPTATCWSASRGSAASCGRSSAPACGTRSSRGGCSSPTSRAWARRRGARRCSRRTTRTRRSSSARRR